MGKLLKRRDYSKTHACVFCSKIVRKIGRHLTSIHKNEPAVAALPPKAKRAKIGDDRHTQITKLRNMGDFNHNLQCLQQKTGELIIGKRPTDSNRNPSDYLPCQFCLRFLAKAELWRHIKRCPFKEDSLGEENKFKQIQKESELLLMGGGHGILDEKENEAFLRTVVLSFRKDAVSNTIKYDPLIVLYGKYKFQKLGSTKAHVVREKMRRCGRLLITLRDLSKKSDALMQNFLHPQYFDLTVQAVKKIADAMPMSSLNGHSLYSKPSLALKLGQDLKKMSYLRQGQAIRISDSETEADVRRFLSLHEREWTDRVSSNASQSASEARYNKAHVLPLTEDLVKVKNYQATRLQELQEQLRSQLKTGGTSVTPIWKELAKVVLTKLIAFNKRRGNEPSRLRIQTYHSQNRMHGNAEIAKTLSPVEQHLLKTMHLIEVIGKQGNKVPIILGDDEKAAIDLLIEARKHTDILEENPYVFARGAANHIDGCHAMRAVVNKVPDLQNPADITSTSMRKYFATVCQIMNLSDVQLEEVANHMGHKLTVHRRFYRLQHDIIELAKVSKLLLAIENGEAAHFANIPLDEIDLDHIKVTSEKPDENGLIDPSIEDHHGRAETVTNIPLAESNLDLDDGEPTAESRSRPTTSTGRRPKRKVSSSSSSSSCGEIPKRKKKKTGLMTKTDGKSGGMTKIAKPRRTWPPSELAIIRKELLPIVKKKAKPPTKTEVLHLQAQFPVLATLNWCSIKFRAWDMFQKVRREENAIKQSISHN